MPRFRTDSFRSADVERTAGSVRPRRCARCAAVAHETISSPQAPCAPSAPARACFAFPL